jgi:hypothetical protein
MLGWHLVIYPQSVQVAGTRSDLDHIASWKAGLGGTRWIVQLCASGDAVDLGGDGYPNRYLITAAVLRAVLRDGVPQHDSPPVVGDDYYLPRGWTGDAELQIERLNALPGHTLLAVDAWDQS